MTPEAFQRLREVFLHARALDRADRDRFLQANCGDDGALHERALSLLRASESEDAFLDTPILGARFSVADFGAPTVAPMTPVAPPASIAGHRVLRLLGSGSMGLVYLAEQASTRRRVALKVLRPELAASSLHRRFEGEIDALARLRHEGIAHIYEAGAVELGGHVVPYLTMEYVDGCVLSDHSCGRDPDLRSRLGLMLKICEAVAHVHENGIVHRDLKPANILVNRRGQPKIVDFGLARLLSSVDLTRATLAGSIFGTLSYMSPEQVCGAVDEIDARSDVYALGVICYELLAGRLPHAVQSLPLPQAARVITEQDPRPLVTCNAAVSDELGAIVHAALARDPRHRYADGGSLALDLRRLLQGEPTLRTSPAARLAARLATGLATSHEPRRSRRFLALGALFSALGVCITGWALGGSTSGTPDSGAQLRPPRPLGSHATAPSGESADRARVDALRTYLLSLLKRANPKASRDAHSLRPMLDVVAAEAGVAFHGLPDVEADVRDVLSLSFREWGRYDSARRQCVLAADLRKDLFGASDPRTLSTLNHLGVSMLDAGQFDEGRKQLQSVCSTLIDLHGARDPEALRCLVNLVQALRCSGQVEAAQRLAETGLQLSQSVLGDAAPVTISCSTELAWLLKQRGMADAALPLLRQALRDCRRVLGERDAGTLGCMNKLALLLMDRKRLDEAESLLQRSLSMCMELYGEDHPMTLETLHNLAALLGRRQRWTDAEELQERVWQGRSRVLGPLHPDTLASRNNLGYYFEQLNQTHAAEMHYRGAMQDARQALPRGHWWTAVIEANLGRMLSARGSLVEAEEHLMNSHGALVDALGPTHRRSSDLARVLDQVQVRAGRGKTPGDR